MGLKTRTTLFEQHGAGRLRYINLTTNMVTSVGPAFSWHCGLAFIQELNFALVMTDNTVRMVNPSTWTSTTVFIGPWRYTQAFTLTRPAATTCSVCPVGTFSNTSRGDKSWVCTNCPAGTFGTGLGLSACAGCAAGFYSTATGASSSQICVSCAAGTFSTALGLANSSQCNGCIMGTFSNNGSSICTDCSTGTYSSARVSTACVSCRLGSTRTKLAP